MIMSSELAAITLYIHPGQGPISAMPFNMLEIEIAVVGLPATADRDAARVREIANRIKKHFPHVEPDTKLQDLRWLVGRLSNIAMFDGIVLKMPGMIEGPSPPKNPTAIEFQKLAEETLNIKAELERKRQLWHEAQAKVKNLTDENARLLGLDEPKTKENASLRSRQAELESNEYKAKEEVIRYRERMSQLEQEKVALQVQLDKAKQERQTLRTAQQEVATLREQLKSAKDTEQQLRTRVKKLESDLTDLRDRLRRLSENPSPGKPDDAGGPWLD
jgi:predicted nuclease with TOPRIM domain